MKSKIWLSSPHMGGGEMKYVQEAFDQNWVAPLGKNVDEFENAIQEFIEEDKFVAALSSGTAALHLALIQLGVGYGDEVICQSFTFSASANPIKYLGANPVFVDSDPVNWNMSPFFLEEAIKDRISKNKKPKAVIIVHLYGMPALMDEITAICSKYEIPLIEDSAEALGSIYKNKKCGTFGDFAILSFNGNKIITTSGGGALVGPTKETKEKTIFLSTQARDNAPHYQHSEIGYNYRLSNICAGIGRGQMEVLSDRIQQRRAVNDFYKDVFSNIDAVNLFSEASSDFFSNHWLSSITIDKKVTTRTNQELMAAFAEENIETRPLWKPMHLQPVFNDCQYFGETVSEELFTAGLCLPSGSNITNDDKNRIYEVISNYQF
ncbi:aminotransferase class I/II-fold pyridoxal phosphate-dependent enzyme [Epilithonimonas vandammei]|uniref:Aminotransferase class I/II-fold pyridoxal phosphate-dependent enzyme n=1 Tax=Epilithonimonas vandammei TaxID=2487072 RepID=A0A3G8YAV0_9FLAO|nr:aminotransferase class I/II-fold pyridoxal phosphate-dependent enzyme [Epilithonimonas vandammei]AZI39604.1 aminotransferase class I/II-fold pyridoxal phosphate-dependent enzyme [Epilithonimonas vandammei]